jgi:cytoskeletal protein RodZ
MADYSNRGNRNRIVIKAQSRSDRRGPQSYSRRPAPKTKESLLAISVIAAAALATFIALFLTSRPYDPMNSTVLPQQTIPLGPAAVQPSPKPSPSTSTQTKAAAGQSPTPATETTGAAGTNDAGIQAQIERALAADSVLSNLDVSTLVEGGKVTLVGSVGSADLKNRVEKAISSVRGVVTVDNQLVVTASTP